MKKIISIMTAVALVAGALCLVGCGQNNEQLIREKLTEELDTFKNQDDSALSSIATAMENEGLDEMGIDSQEFAAAVLNGFDYTIDDVQVNGDTANATVTIVSKSSSDFTQRITEVAQTLVDDPAIAELTSEEKMSKLGEAVMQAFDETEVVTETATIEYKLNNNTWEPVDGSNSLASLDSIVFAR